MALFSRRKKPDDAVVDDATVDDAVRAADAASAAAASAEAVPHVPISVSTFGAHAEPAAAPAAAGPPSAPVPRSHAFPGAETAPRDAGVVPGLRDNVLLRDALAALPPKAQPVELMNVSRQLLQGHVYLRVRGDARELLAAGEGLPMAVANHDGESYVLVYSSGLALQTAVRADGDLATSAIAQGVPALLRQVVDGPFGGLAIDHASTPASAILPKPLLEKALAELDPALTLKTLLAGPRTGQTPADVAAALADAPLWIAARRDDDGRIGIAEVRTADGTRLLEIFSHPLELVALGRGDRPVKVTGEQLGRALRSDAGIAGVVVDPLGPWIRLSRKDLQPVLALAR